MDCAHFEQRLEALLAGALAPPERALLEQHRAGCERCGRLWASFQEETVPGRDAATDAFVSILLERTSGAPCGRAQESLPGWVDGALSPDDAGLIAMHLQHCSGCAALAAAVATLRLELPSLAETEPGPEFTTQVLASTQALQRRRTAVGTRWLDTWQHLLQRPRFALEFATAACFLLMLLCALPFSPFRPLPQQALAAIRLDGGGLLIAATSRVGPALQSTAHRAWAGTAGRIETALAAKGRALPDEHGTPAWGGVRADLSEARAGIESRNFPRFSQALHELGGDLRRLWAGSSVPAAAPAGGSTPEDPR